MEYIVTHLHKELNGFRAVIGKFQAIIGFCFHKCFTEKNCFENRTKQRRRQNWKHPCGTISGYKCLHECTLANGFVYLGQVSPKKLVADTWAATRDEEHAVSMDSDGPFSPSVKLMRPHTTLHRHHNKHPGQPMDVHISIRYQQYDRSPAQMFVDSRVLRRSAKELQCDITLLRQAQGDQGPLRAAAHLRLPEVAV